MQYEDNMGATEGSAAADRSALEDRIIAHFDGSLDAPSSKALLDEVMASPEKRALFRAHETLNRVIASARVPMEAPLETKREIADRIPGLIAFIPGLLGTAETMPILQQSTNPFISFFAKMSLQTAVSIGSAIAVLTTAGIIVKNNIDNNAAQPAKTAVVQNVTPATSQPSAGTPAQSYAEAPANTTFHQYVKAPVSAKVSGNGTPQQSISTLNSNVVASQQERVRSAVAEPASQTNWNASQDATTDDNGNLPTIGSAFDSPKSTSAVAANIPAMQAQILMPMPDEVGEGITVRPYASSGTRMLQLPGINNSTGYIKGVANTTVGLEFELGDRYSFRVQGGQSSFTKFSYAQAPGMIAGLPVYTATVGAQSAGWTTVGISYAFALTQSFPLILSADGGAVWSGGLMGMLGLSTELPLTGQLVLRPTLTYDVVRTSIPSPAQTNAIYIDPIDQTSMTTGAFGFQLNFMFRP